jgi:thioredoxin reductase (NADPH)
MRHEAALIAGAGPIGIACAIAAKRRGLDPLVIDAGAVCDSIRRYPVGMTFFTTPERLEIGGHPLVCAGQKPTREEALKYYRGVVRAEGLRVSTYTRLAGACRAEAAASGVDTGASAAPRGLIAELATRRGSERIACERLVLATGYFDHPNLLGVPGEDLPHVRHYYDEAHASFGLDVVIVGGRNSAVEAALDLFRAGARVALVYRGAAFPPSVKYWLRPDLENRIRAGEIAAHLGAEVLEIDPERVRIRAAGGGERDLPADRVYTLTGFHPDFSLFERLGIELDRTTQEPRLDPATLETNVPGIHMVGSITRGRRISDVFIENGRFDGDKVFGDAVSRARAESLYQAIKRHHAE